MFAENNISEYVTCKLDENKIIYQKYEHNPTFTMEECLALPFIDDNVTMCKNVLLCNRQKTNFYLLLLKPYTKIITSQISKKLESSRLSFAPSRQVQELLGTSYGCLSPFGLFFDKNKEVELFYESEIKHTSKIAFHPNQNNQTLVFEQLVFWQKVIPLIGTTPREIVLNDCIEENNL